ncbi:MAG: hypothetical protein AAF797_03585 [Planctomycetota bacterium]
MRPPQTRQRHHPSHPRIDPHAAEREAEEALAKKERIKEERREAKQARRKTDPELLAFSRELRDRWQEHVTAQPHLLEDQSQTR